MQKHVCDCIWLLVRVEHRFGPLFLGLLLADKKKGAQPIMVVVVHQVPSSPNKGDISVLSENMGSESKQEKEIKFNLFASRF